MPKHPMALRELVKRLKPFGIRVMERKRGKGSELILLKPIEKGSSKGPQIPVKNHGQKTEIYIPVIQAILRRFEIDPKEFWD